MKLLICFVVTVLLGLCALYFAPQFPAVGAVLVGVSVILGLQAALLALVSKFSPPVSDMKTVDIPTEYPNELSYLLDKYRELKVAFLFILARVAGVAGLVYGVMTMNTYYTILGVAMILLFSILDRMSKPAGNSTDVARSQSSPVSE